MNRKAIRNAERTLRAWYRRGERPLVCRRPAIEALVFAGLDVERLLEDGVVRLVEDDVPRETRIAE